ncbi:MDR family MFS transporter [Spirillospora sp. CA-142024]|uniref:MDR family MFS transporter n=1 Tax=Spirillospora sp. CA-142024 TaxID=3240036 RepID=UPI003D923CF3
MTAEIREDPPPAPAAASSTGFPPELRRVIIVAMLGGLVVMLDSTIVNIALQTLSADLHASLTVVQWVVTGYMLAMGMVIPVSGWLARRLGARRVLAAATAAFTLASLACGLAQNTEQLVAFRVLQGLAGGLMTPVGQIIIVRAAGPRRLARVMALIGIPTIMAPVAGPTLGGLLLEHASWEWIFLVNVPIGAVAAWLALRMLPHDAQEEAGTLDVPGLVLVVAGSVGVTYGLAKVGERGDAALGAAWTAGGAVLLGLFVLRSLRVERPLLDVRLFRNPAFSAASLVTFGFGASIFGGMILLPIYFQVVRHESTVATGLLLVPQGLGALASIWASGRITERFGPGRTSLAGGVIAVVTTVPFLFISADVPYPLLDTGLVARGLGIGLSGMPAMTAAFNALGRAEIADATPQLNVVQRFGASVGTAIFAVVLQHGLDGAGGMASRQADAFGTAFAWVLGATVVAAVPTVLLIATERRRSARGSDQ